MKGYGTRRIRSLIADRRGAAALEFAVTGAVFFGMALFVVALGFRLYVNVALDYAASRAARLLAVDSNQTLSSNAATFQVVTFCPLLSAFLSCSDITISLQPVTDYAGGSQIGGSSPPPFNPGQGGSLMLLQVSYGGPTISWPAPDGSGTSGAFAPAAVSVGYPYQNEY